MHVEGHVVGLAADSGEAAALVGRFLVALDFGRTSAEDLFEELLGAFVPETVVERIGAGSAEVTDAFDLAIDGALCAGGVFLCHGWIVDGARRMGERLERGGGNRYVQAEGESAMFQTIGRTWRLAKLSWGVLLKDKELLVFPLLSFVAIAIIVGAFASIAFATGSFDRLDAAMANEAGSTEEGVNIFDVALYVVGFVAVTFAVVFFNSALVAAALERLRGGDPNVASGFRAVLPHIHNILGWAIISATVGLVLQAVRSRTENMLGRIVLSLVGGIWAYVTFFVVPVLVVQGVGPVDAIKRSASLFKRTWGEQVTSNFGFGIFYVVAVLVALIPAAIAFSIHPIAGLVLGIPLVALAMGAVQATEGIFKAALYEFAAEGVVPQGFEDADLESSYGPKEGRGRGFV